MATFSIKVKNLDSISRALDRYGDKAEDAIWFGLERTAFEVKDYAVTVVHKITSDLARSIQITDRNRAGLSLSVTTNKSYARIEEKGFNGIMGVAAHDRTIKEAFGKKITPVTVVVSSHIRHVFRRPHPYMEPAAQLGQRNINRNVLAELRAIKL
jgi:hypothetical protein